MLFLPSLLAVACMCIAAVTALPVHDHGIEAVILTAVAASTAAAVSTTVAPLHVVPHQSRSKSPRNCGEGNPTIYVNNSSPDTICYMVELNPTAERIDLDSHCGSGNGFVVAAGQVREFCPGTNFVGALTAFIGKDAVRGARHEFDFERADITFYDIDYEMALSNSTLGPADGAPRSVDGRALSSLAGEVDILAKANRAWWGLDTARKAALLATGYARCAAGDWRNLTGVRMDKEAPKAVVRFLQMKANLTGYVVAGSVRGIVPVDGSDEDLLVDKADAFTWGTGTRRMNITAY